MENKKLKYYIYARKSSESEDRQVLSIDAQVDEMKQLAKQTNRILLDIKSEAKSAKQEGRPIFNEILKDLEQGSVQGLIVWHPDRLSRNAMDAARLIDLLDRNKLQEIVTPSQVFKNTPTDKFMFSLLCSQAKMDNDNKGINVKRGMKAKAKLGVYPGSLPTGYLSIVKIRGNRAIESDTERLPLIRKMMDLMLSGNHNALAVREIANEEWGFRMPGGKKLGRTTIYNIFTNPFYCGSYEFPRGSGEWYEGTHEAIISKEEFDTIQYMMGRKGRPRPKKHVFDFTGLIKCGECGASVTAEAKFKKTKAGKVHSYVYYHCTKRMHPSCTQKCLEEQELVSQVISKLDSLDIPPEFHTYAMKWFKSENERTYEKANAALDAQERAYKACIRKLENLAHMRASEEISAEEYSKMKAEELEHKFQLEKARGQTGKDINTWIETGDEMLTFIEKAKGKFLNEGRDTRRDLISTLGSNLILLNKKLNIDLENTLLPMQKVSPVLKEIKERLEPLNIVDKQAEFDRICEQNPVVLPDLDSNQDTRLQRAMSYH